MRRSTIIIIAIISFIAMIVAWLEKAKVSINKEEFIQAISDKNINKVQDLLNKGVDANVLIDKKFTPILLAAYDNNIDMIYFLLDNGAKLPVNYPPSSGLRRLVNAFLMKDDFDKIDFILENNCKIQELEPQLSGYFLEEGAGIYTAEAVKYLISKGVKLNYRNTETKDYPIFMALRAGRYDNLEILLDAGASTDVLSPITRKEFRREVLDLYRRKSNPELKKILDRIPKK